MLCPLLAVAALMSCSSSKAAAPPTSAEVPRAATTASSPITTSATVAVAVGQQTCITVVRPTTGELAVPDPEGGDRLAAPITWSNAAELEPPPADQTPAFSRESIHLEGSTPPPVTKLATFHDPSHRTWSGDGQLVWAVFYPAVPSAGSRGPSGMAGEQTTTTIGPAPCAMRLETYDAATGAPYLYLSVG